MILRELSLRDGDEAGEARLRGEEIVEAGVEPVLADVKPDREQMSLAVVEKLVVDVGQLSATRREAVERRKTRSRALGGLQDGRAEPLKPVVAQSGRSAVQYRVDGREQRQLQARSFAERRHVVQPVQAFAQVLQSLRLRGRSMTPD